MRWCGNANGSIRRSSIRPLPDEREEMSHPYNGMPASQLTGVTWQKSLLSNPSGNCVEMAALPHGGFAVRNSRDPQGPALVYTRDEMVAFIQGARQGDFDNLIS
jgi:hypothetical protein